MNFIKLPLPLSVNRMYERTKRRVYLNPEAAQYKSTVNVLARKWRNLFGSDEKEIIYFTLWGLRNKRGDNHNNEKLLWDALEYANVYPNDRLLRHSAGSTYVMDKEKIGFVIVGLSTYEDYLEKPFSLNELSEQAKALFSIS